MSEHDPLRGTPGAPPDDPSAPGEPFPADPSAGAPRPAAEAPGPSGGAPRPDVGGDATADRPGDDAGPAADGAGDDAGPTADGVGDDAGSIADRPGDDAGPAADGAGDDADAPPAPGEERTAILSDPADQPAVDEPTVERAAGLTEPAADERTAVIADGGGGPPAASTTGPPAGEPAAEERTAVAGEPVGSGAWSAAGGGGASVPPGGGGASCRRAAGGVPPGGGGGYVPPGGGGYPPPGPPPGGSVPPGGQPPPYQGVRRIRRSRDRKVIAGVAGGLGEYTGVDPVLLRVLFAVLAVFGGAGILLYLLCWLFLPADDEPSSPVESLIGRGSGGRRAGDVVQAALLVVVGLILAGVLARGDGGDVFLLLVVVAGIVLLVRNLDERREGRPPPPPPVTPPPAAYQAYQQDPYPYDPTRTAAMPTGPAPTATAVQPPVVPPPPPVKPRKERSILGRLTLSALLLVLGITAALDAAGADPQARHYFALALGVVGIGLVVGAWRGRARGLIWLGVPLAVALVAVSTAEVSLEGGTGDRQYRPQSVGEVQDEYRVGIGNLVLDLTDIDFAERTVVTSASAGLGNVEVRVPRDVDVEVVARAGIGEADLFDERVNGGSQQRTVVDNGLDGPGGGDLQLTLEVGVGRVEVDRATS